MRVIVIREKDLPNEIAQYGSARQSNMRFTLLQADFNILKVIQ